MKDTRAGLYSIGDFVETVDLLQFAHPVEVPIPKRWYLLRVFPHREFKVMKTFGQRGISAWLPLLTTMQDITRYRRGYECIQQQNVTSPMISGAIIIPDYELADDRVHRWREVDGVIGLHIRLSSFIATQSTCSAIRSTIATRPRGCYLNSNSTLPVIPTRRMYTVAQVRRSNDRKEDDDPAATWVVRVNGFPVHPCVRSWLLPASSAEANGAKIRAPHAVRSNAVGVFISQVLHRAAVGRSLQRGLPHRHDRRASHLVSGRTRPGHGHPALRVPGPPPGPHPKNSRVLPGAPAYTGSARARPASSFGGFSNA
jgi:Transcription termination factor nusG